MLAAIAAVSAQAGEPTVTIYNGDDAKTVLYLCSRSAPPEYDGTWVAGMDNVAFVEEKLVTEHPEILRNAHVTEAEFRDTFVREYAGFTRDGVDYLYGSFGPRSGIALCDGGPRFFGVEFEMPSGVVTHTAYNGVT